MAIKTRLGLSGTPGRPYAAWQAKEQAQPFTAAGAYRWVRMVYRRAARMVYRRTEQMS